MQYLELVSAKRRAVEEWKRESSRARRRAHENALGDGMGATNEIGVVTSGEDNAASTLAPSGKLNEDVRLAAKQRIRAWRAERENQEQLEKVTSLSRLCLNASFTLHICKYFTTGGKAPDTYCEPERRSNGTTEKAKSNSMRSCEMEKGGAN